MVTRYLTHSGPVHVRERALPDVGSHCDTEPVPYYHVRLTAADPRRHQDELALDLSRDQLENRFLVPRRRAQPVTLSGRTYGWDEIDRLRINETEQPSARLLPEIRAEQAASSVVVAIPDEWYVTKKGRDVTDELITEPPGSGAQLTTPVAGEELQADPRVVMVVHGRNEAARRDLFSFLRDINLRPQEWPSLVEQTGEPAPYVGQVLDHAFASAKAVVVLFTPDDEARLRHSLRGERESEHETRLTGQARQNVIFEAGLAFGRHPDRTVLVELGELRPISDLEGRHAVRLDGSAERLRDLARRLENAGCAVDRSGDDWQEPSNFPALKPSSRTAGAGAPDSISERKEIDEAIQNWDSHCLEVFERAGGAPLSRPQLIDGVPYDQFEGDAADRWLENAEMRGLTERAGGVPTRWHLTADGEQRLRALR